MRQHRASSERGVGPFTGSHLTVIACTLALLIAFPLAASAVTGNNVFLTDATTGSHVRVGPHHSLEESVHDAATGKAAKIGVDGRLATNAAGTVGAAATFPTKDIVTAELIDGIAPTANDDCLTSAVCVRLIQPPPGKTLVVTSIHVDVFRADATGPGKDIIIEVSADNTCAFGQIIGIVDKVHPAAVGVTVLNYPPPGGWMVLPGEAVCLRSPDPAHIQAQVTAFGYAVPPSQVP